MASNSLVVGGLSGIGSAVRDCFEKRGDIVFTSSRRRSESPHHLRQEMPHALEIDPSQKFNYLVFTHRYRGDDWDEDFDVMVKGIHCVLEQLMDSFLGEASIVIFGSSAARYVASEQSASYHASRGALESLTKFYASKLGGRGIRCNCVIPSTIVKPENETYFSAENPIRNMLEKITPLGRMGSAEDVANLTAFLCSTKSSFITGQTFFVDGGLSILSQEYIARQFLDKK